jgi:hypothetical protein
MIQHRQWIALVTNWGIQDIAVCRISVYLAGCHLNWITSFTRTETNEPRCCKQTVSAVQQYGVCTKVRSCTLPGGWESSESCGSSAGDVDQCTLWVRTADSGGLSCQVSSQPWGTTRALTAGVKRPGLEARQSSSSSAGVKNAFSCVYFHHLCRAEASDFTEVLVKKLGTGLDGESEVWGKMDGSHTCLGTSSPPPPCCTVVTLLKVNCSIYRYWALHPFIMFCHYLSP